MKIVFVPHNAYHTRTFLSVCKYLNSEEIIFLNIDRFHHEGVGEVLKTSHYPVLPYSAWSIHKIKPDIIVVMNDWGKWPAHAVREGKRRGIPTVSHVEGAQDYLDTHIIQLKKGPVRNPYQHSEYVFLLGDYDKKFITHDKTYATGSPRFDELKKMKKETFPAKVTVGINCNFSYGLYEEIAQNWIRDIVSACESLNFEYLISQHRADVTDLRGLNLYKGSVYNMINDSTVFVSRFSTCMLESLVLGRPVIYYNPHGEIQDTFQEPMGAYPIVRNKSELSHYINDICNNPLSWLDKSKAFLNYHVAHLEDSSSQYFASKLLEIGNMDRQPRRVLLPSQLLKYYRKQFLQYFR